MKSDTQIRPDATPDLGRTEARYRVTEHVLDSIRNGACEVGELLPSARRLAKVLDVDRRTVQGALRLLQEEGYLRRRRGGRFEFLAAAPKATRSKDSVCVALSRGARIEDEAKTLSGWSNYVELGVQEIEKHTELRLQIVDFEDLTISRVEALASQNPTGFVYGSPLYDPSQLYKLLRPLQARGIPVVVCGDAPELSAFDRTDSDHETGGYLLAQHLLAQGCRRLVMYRHGDAESLPYWYAARRRGYERALRAAGLPVLPLIQVPLIQTCRRGRAGFDAKVRMAAGFLIEPLQQGVDGILCDSDGHTFGVGEACRLLGHEPGKEVLVAGYDNYAPEVYDRHYTDFLPQATVDKHNRELGQAMVDLLLRRIHDELSAEPQRVLLTPDVVELTGESN